MNKPERLSAFKREPRATIPQQYYRSAIQVLCLCYARAMQVRASVSKRSTCSIEPVGFLKSIIQSAILKKEVGFEGQKMTIFLV